MNDVIVGLTHKEVATLRAALIEYQKRTLHSATLAFSAPGMFAEGRAAQADHRRAARLYAKLGRVS